MGKILSYPALTSLDSTFSFLGADTATPTVTNITSMATVAQKVANVIYPSGDTTGATDVTNINAALANGGAVQLVNAPLSAPYFIDSPILPSTGSRLWGAQFASASENDDYSEGVGASVGTVIVMVSGFTGAAAISFPDPGSGVQAYGVDLAGFTIEGYECENGASYGIEVVGAWGACFMRGVMIHRPPLDCFRAVASSATLKVPDEWVIFQCKFSASRGGNGATLSYLDDSVFTDCNFSENDADGLNMTAGENTRFTDCKFENNKANGAHLTGIGSGSTVYFNGCDTHENAYNGFLFDNTSGDGSAEGRYVLNGCSINQDGQGSTTAGYAGIQVDGCASPVIVNGGNFGYSGTTSEPQYAASQVSSSAGLTLNNVDFNGGLTYDDGSNTSPLNTGPMSRVATTGPSGIALADSTSTLISWTAPDDGQMHRVQFYAIEVVSSVMTGGIVYINVTYPNGTAKGVEIFPAQTSAGQYLLGSDCNYLIEAGTTASVVQDTALTAGAATVYAEIWGS